MLNYIQTYLADNHRSPLLREIQAGCEIPSYKSVVDRLNALERKGYIARQPNKHRGISIVKALFESQHATSVETEETLVEAGVL